MKYSIFGDTYVVRLQKGEEVLTCLQELCRKESISLGIVSAIGAVKHVSVGVYRVEEQEYIATVSYTHLVLERMKVAAI